MVNLAYEMRRAEKHGMSLDEWLAHKSKKTLNPEAELTHVYHHTNILFSHLIWSSGVVDIESEQTRTVEHPFLEKFQIGGSLYRRTAKDFPRVAWFTSNRTIPRCLEDGELIEWKGLGIPKN